MRFGIEAGWLQQAERHPSPNQDDRPDGADIALVIVHGISLPPGHFGGDGIDRLFTNRLDPSSHPYYREIAELRVSAHLLIRRDGQLIQYVPFHRRAWHAGVSSHRGRERCNDFSVGIELEGTDDTPYRPVQYRRLARVIAALGSVHPGIRCEEAVGHCHVAPGRKTDPGPAFRWDLLAQLRALAEQGASPNVACGPMHHGGCAKPANYL